MPIPGTSRKVGISPAVTTSLGGFALAALLVGCQASDRTTGPTESATGVSFTAGSGTQGTLMGRATFADPFKAKRKTGEWEVEIEAPNPIDVAVQTITFQPGGYSGWHSHPGPVFVQVISGTMTFYESDDPTCSPLVFTVGQGYQETGDHAHIAYNRTSSPATVLVAYFTPPGAAVRVDEPNPGNCAF